MPNSDKISSKDKIIEAAVIHLNREGLNNFTATALTRSANLGYGTFYKYFSSTEDVLESAIKKNVTDWSLMISESNKKEPDRLLAFLEAIYKTILQVSNNASMRWLLEKPNYFVEIYFDLTRHHAIEDVKSAIASGQLTSEYLENFETKFKLHLWQICGGISMVDEGYNYKEIALELIKLIIPTEVKKEKAIEICEILKNRNY
ncbi:TetR/AcrR family transcriptional regulator [SAR86 cluster bacterium]|nr:TetR/AcrR family transcriptional regulator [SAR86 cluster bacterium]MDC3150728.1 TetR/AcrR family transcriptional regulator [SAR86 cluster bacterium]